MTKTMQYFLKSAMALTALATFIAPNTAMAQQPGGGGPGLSECTPARCQWKMPADWAANTNFANVEAGNAPVVSHLHNAHYMQAE